MDPQQTPFRSKRDQFHDSIKSEQITVRRKKIRQTTLKNHQDLERQNTFKQICSDLDADCLNKKALNSLINVINQQEFKLTEKLCLHLLSIMKDQQMKMNIKLKTNKKEENKQQQKSKEIRYLPLAILIEGILDKSFKDLQKCSYDDPKILNFALRLISNQNYPIRRLALEWIFVLTLNYYSKQYYVDNGLIKQLIKLQKNQYNNVIEGIVYVLLEYVNSKLPDDIMTDIIKLFKTHQGLFTDFEQDRLEVLQKLTQSLIEIIQTKSKFNIIGNEDYLNLLMLLVQKLQTVSFHTENKTQYPHYNIYKFTRILSMVSETLTKIYLITPQIKDKIACYYNRIFQINKQFNFFTLSQQSIDSALNDQQRDQRQKQFIQNYLSSYLSFLFISQYRQFNPQNISLITFLYQLKIRNVNTRNICLKLLLRAAESMIINLSQYQKLKSKLIDQYEQQIEMCSQSRDLLTKFILQSDQFIKNEMIFEEEKRLEQKRIENIQYQQRLLEQCQQHILEPPLEFYEQNEEPKEDPRSNNQ